jgi:hypothetical protein
MPSARNQPTRIVARGIDRVTSQPARPSPRSRESDQAAVAAPITDEAARPIASRSSITGIGAGTRATAAPVPM